MSSWWPSVCLARRGSARPRHDELSERLARRAVGAREAALILVAEVQFIDRAAAVRVAHPRRARSFACPPACHTVSPVMSRLSDQSPTVAPLLRACPCLASSHHHKAVRAPQSHNQDTQARLASGSLRATATKRAPPERRHLA